MQCVYHMLAIVATIQFTFKSVRKKIYTLCLKTRLLNTTTNAPSTPLSAYNYPSNTTAACSTPKDWSTAYDLSPR